MIPLGGRFVGAQPYIGSIYIYIHICMYLYRAQVQADFKHDRGLEESSVWDQKVPAILPEVPCCRPFLGTLLNLPRSLQKCFAVPHDGTATGLNRRARPCRIAMKILSRSIQTAASTDKCAAAGRDVLEMSRGMHGSRKTGLLRFLRVAKRRRSSGKEAVTVTQCVVSSLFIYASVCSGSFE